MEEEEKGPVAMEVRLNFENFEAASISTLKNGSPRRS